MADDNKILRLMYTFFLGLLLAIFIGVGINTFYPGPTPPEYVETYVYKDQLSDEQIAKQKEFDAKNREYQNEAKPYNRNVSIIALSAAVLLLILSIVFEKKIRFIADGVMLGGLFTLIYSLGRGFESQDSKYVFVVVTVSLVTVLYIGYHRFVRPSMKLETEKSKQ